jgi:membrane-bound serine protease (ClpP class)
MRSKSWIVTGLTLLLNLPLISAAQQSNIHRIRIDGVINPVSSRFMIEAVARAERENADALVVELDTPGGLLEATRDIVQAFLVAKVPVIVYVSPDGARAGSAGVFITLAANIAAMAPGSNIGAAHPVSIGGGFPGRSDSTGGNTISEKATNDAAALIRSIAETRGRNVEWAEKAVRISDAITARDALAQGVIDLLAPSLDSLLKDIHGKTVKLKEGERIFNTAHPTITTYNMSWRDRFFDKISDPNIAYLFMLAGIYGILFELYNPGAVFPGVIGGLGLLLAFFAFQALPVNAIGILLILFGIILLILEIKVTSYGMLSISGALSLFLGSLMLYDPEATTVHVSLSVIIPAVLGTVVFIVFAVGMGIRAQKRPVETGRESLVGMVGEAIEGFHEASTVSYDIATINQHYVGTIVVNGEYWKADSPTSLAAGSKVKVIAMEGMILKVASN